MDIGTDIWESIIRKGVSEFGVVIDEDAMLGISIHAREMVKFNQKMNLTAITDPYEIAIKHVIDSLAAVPYLPGKLSLLDIGSGAGYPGIPLKLVRPDLDVTLIDGVGRKVSFLKHVIRRLGITGISALHVRAEKWTDSQSVKFDVVITRAVGSLLACWQLALPLINRKSGKLIALKGRVENEELLELNQMNRRVGYCPNETEPCGLAVHHYKLPFMYDQRTIVIQDLMSA